MTFEEASGKYSLMDCVHLTSAKFQAARPAVHVDEQPAFPALLQKARNNIFSYPLRRLVLDISELLGRPNLTGIGRVELELARQFVAMAKTTGDAVVLTGFNGTFFQEYTLADMETMAPTYGLKTSGAPVHFGPADQFLVSHLNLTQMEKVLAAIYRARRAGAVATFMVHDIFPIANSLMAEESFVRLFFIGWSQILRFADRLVTVSRKVSRDVACYVGETSMAGLVPTRPLPVAHFTLGCDGLQNSRNADVSLAYPADRQTFVAAGTFLRHKGLPDLVSAMEILWAEGCKMRLVLLGDDPHKGSARTRLSSLPAFGNTLFMPGYVSDKEFAETLSRSSALVCASNDEGFGLPLVEAANLGCPVIARDIEIFRETSGGDAFFFENGDAGKVAEGLRKWLALTREQQLKFVPRKSLVTWRQSAEMLKAIMFNGVSSFSVEVGLKATVNLHVQSAPQETFNL
ncbi:MAG: glycosyltransferase [Aestuariivirga sp.]|nr:glycosyltransferase [Aestuariivirga sp.]